MRLFSATRLAALVDGFDRRPAYAGLAGALSLAIGDGRIPAGVRLPSERDLGEALGVSRTTATRAYAVLREHGYAEARQGSGTFTRIPGGRARTLDRTLTPRPGDDAAIDLGCASSSAPPGVAAAYAAAVAALPAYLAGHGYYPSGLPELQSALAASYTARGLRTSPEQVVVTSGALGAIAAVARAVVRPGDRVLVEAPGYPNARQAFAAQGARLLPVPVDDHGWDVDLLAGSARQARAAYVVPDFHNPTGRLMADPARALVGRSLAAAGTVVVIDESLQPLTLDGGPTPAPLASYVEEAGGSAVVVGGASKVFWGGLRLGWMRVPPALVDAVSEARLSMDLGSPVVEQLALLELLTGADDTVARHRARLREQRDALAAALRERLPAWTFTPPSGGLAMWCTLPRPVAVPLAAEAERRGVVLAPGPLFAPQGGYAAHVRIPFTRPTDELVRAVGLLAEAWAATEDTTATTTPRRPLVA